MSEQEAKRGVLDGEDTQELVCGNCANEHHQRAAADDAEKTTTHISIEEEVV